MHIFDGSTVRAPVFGRHHFPAPQSIMEKVYYQVKLFVITPYVAGLLHPAIVDHHSVKGGLKVIVCIVVSAEYWCSNSTGL